MLSTQYMMAALCCIQALGHWRGVAQGEGCVVAVAVPVSLRPGRVDAYSNGICQPTWTPNTSMKSAAVAMRSSSASVWLLFTVYLHTGCSGEGRQAMCVQND